MRRLLHCFAAHVQATVDGLTGLTSVQLRRTSSYVVDMVGTYYCRKGLQYSKACKCAHVIAMHGVAVVSAADVASHPITIQATARSVRLRRTRMFL